MPMIIAQRIVATALVLASLTGLPAAAQFATTLTSHGDPIAPSGAVTELHSSLPLREVVDRSGKWLAIIHGGFDVHGVAIVDIASGTIVSRAAVREAYEAIDFSADGTSLLVGAAGNQLISLDFDPATGHLGAGRRIAVPGLYQTALRSLPGGDVLVLTRSLAKPPVTTAAGAPSQPMGEGSVAGTGERFALERITLPDHDTPLQASTARWTVPLPGFPSSLTLAPDGRRAFVTAWHANRLSIVDLDRAALVANVPTPAHPLAVAVAPQHGRLYVACGATNSVAVFDATTPRLVGTIDVGALSGAPLGATPNALALSRDEQTLYVANADENAVIRVRLDGNGGVPVGAIHTDMYPTDVLLAADERSLYVLDGKGSDVKANPLYDPHFTIDDRTWQDILRASPQTAPLANQEFGGHFGTHYYIASLEPGQLERIDLSGVDDAAGLRSLRDRMSRRAADTPPLPPIKHVIYILRENRTYDQVLGDDTRGNGDPQLAMFGQRVTPNAHALVDGFVLADNYRLESEVSVPGWAFAFTAYAPDLNQRSWPAGYGDQPLPAGPSGGTIFNEPEWAPGGYFWDDALRAGRSVRIYNMSDETFRDPLAAPYTAPMAAKHFYDDGVAFQQWLDEFRLYEKNGNLPALEVMPLSADHTLGTQPYSLTPNALVATNDYYLGRMIDVLSHSQYWRDTVIFATEDDAQNGPDHVSSERSVMVVAGGYVRRNFVDHTPYLMTGMIRTMELLLGLKPMTEYDATATVMSSIFAPKPDLTPYQVHQPEVSLTDRNPPIGIEASVSAHLRFDRPDENDPALLNRVLWEYALASGDLPRSSRWAWTPPPSRGWSDPDDGTTGDEDDPDDQDADD